MPSENIKTIEAFYDLLNQGALDEALDLCGPDVTADFSRSINVEIKGVYRDPDQVRDFYGRFTDAWKELEWFTSEEYVEHGDRLLRIGGIRARGRGSGVEVIGEGAQVWHFREGRPVLMEQFQSKAEALEHIGK